MILDPMTMTREAAPSAEGGAGGREVAGEEETERGLRADGVAQSAEGESALRRGPAHHTRRGK